MRRNSDATANGGDAMGRDGEATAHDGDAMGRDGEATAHNSDAKAHDGDATGHDVDHPVRVPGDLLSTKPRKHETTKPRNHETAKPRNHETAKPRNGETAKARIRESANALGFVLVVARSAISGCVMSAALVSAAAVTTLGAPTQVPAFRIDAYVVAMSVTVTDSAGRWVPGLAATNFTVFEDGRPRPIGQFTSDAVPISLLIAIDISGSMQGPRFERARAAALRLADRLTARDEVALYAFNDMTYRLADWTNEKARIVDELRTIKPSGGTALYEAVETVLDPLRDRAARNRREDVRHRQAVVIISDGRDHAPPNPVAGATTPEDLSFQHQAMARALIQQSEALLYAIGINAPNTIGRDALIDSPALHALTDRTGGFTEVVDGDGDLVPVAERIAEELRRQYLIGFTPATLDGKFHRVKVQVNGCPGCQVRSRAGFIAAPANQRPK